MVFARLKAHLTGILAGLLLAGLLAATAVAFIPSLSFPFSLPFTGRERSSAGELILREVRPVFTLSTVEYSYKSVFPYDFLPEGIEIRTVAAKQFRGEELSPKEREAAELLRLCRRVGIDPAPASYQFVVVRSRVRGGFRLAGTAWDARPGDHEPAAPGSPSGADNASPRIPPLASVIDLDRSRSRVEIVLPPPEITSFTIADETSEEYRYPDIEVDPSEWKLITGYVRQRIEERVIAEGILERSRERAERLVTRLLQEAGWKEVVCTSARQ